MSYHLRKIVWSKNIIPTAADTIDHRHPPRPARRALPPPPLPPLLTIAAAVIFPVDLCLPRRCHCRRRRRRRRYSLSPPPPFLLLLLIVVSPAIKKDGDCILLIK